MQITVEESERVVRVLRLLDLVYDTLGEGEAVERWLRESKPFLGERTLLEALETEAGARILEEELYALQYGFSA